MGPHACTHTCTCTHTHTHTRTQLPAEHSCRRRCPQSSQPTQDPFPSLAGCPAPPPQRGSLWPGALCSDSCNQQRALGTVSLGKGAGKTSLGLRAFAQQVPLCPAGSPLPSRFPSAQQAPLCPIRWPSAPAGALCSSFSASTGLQVPTDALLRPRAPQSLPARHAPMLWAG